MTERTSSSRHNFMGADGVRRYAKFPCCIFRAISCVDSGSYDGMYRDDRYSRRGRDMRGRYSRHDGTDKRLMDELEELMRTIEPGKRDVIRRALEELKEA